MIEGDYDDIGAKGSSLLLIVKRKISVSKFAIVVFFKIDLFEGIRQV